jgi:hypothetical protein
VIILALTIIGPPLFYIYNIVYYFKAWN